MSIKVLVFCHILIYNLIMDVPALAAVGQISNRIIYEAEVVL